MNRLTRTSLVSDGLCARHCSAEQLAAGAAIPSHTNRCCCDCCLCGCLLSRMPLDGSSMFRKWIKSGAAAAPSTEDGAASLGRCSPVPAGGAASVGSRASKGAHDASESAEALQSQLEKLEEECQKIKHQLARVRSPLLPASRGPGRRPAGPGSSPPHRCAALARARLARTAAPPEKQTARRQALRRI